ncbi:hypothetical protein [Corynebacterium sp. AOP12-C2-36]|uniref:hypothetical protein n=1 Tax=Corynebacterium sp. AOP12-C2-36 TaxID=3457723 RepID=UPI004034E9A0
MGPPPTSNAHTASMDYDINLSGESGVSADVNTSLTSAGGAGTDASQVGTHTTSAAGAPAAPAAGAAPMAPAPAAGAAGAGFMAAGGTGSGGGDAWGRHRRETPAALSIEPDPTVSPKSDKALDGFGRNTRRAIKQLATLDEALGTRSTGAPLALAVINSGRSVYATSDAFGFPDADTAAEVGALPAGAVPLAALLDEIPEEFLTSWVGATDPAGVMALAADKGYISPKVIFDVGRDENLPLPAGVEVVDRATLSSITPAAAASEGRRLLEDLETLDQDGLTDLSEMLTQLAKLWGMPMDADLETDEAHAAMVKRRWSSGGRPDQVQVATVWWLLLAAADALVDGTPSYASAALRMVLGFPLPSMSADAADVAGAAV